MGLRVKLRRAFTSKKASPDDSTPRNEQYYTDRTDIEYYKPHEIPKSKYKGRVDPEHQANLAAFSLADAFSTARRRTSLALSGSFSPGGTKAQSRAASRDPSQAPSRRSSCQDQPGSRRRMESAGESDGSDDSTSTSREKSVAASTAPGPDTASTSLSDQPTAAPFAPAELTAKLTQHDSGIDMGNGLLKQVTAPDTPFTAEELEQAMSRATLKPRGLGAEGKGIGVAS
ncbi:uncharacterized protein Z518_02707 [Rhinocladiella mackenziei CBS 650.93]|uniref:Uncharacterized protein n=1 Tax=Rhinocladiella mackenziei CBS 650.93 TaxID=1442369 RepID=A0A0D2G0N1_9EURO|nr:uncharacterized protein Z518_02707 [Rhinocladiella mackenziei CBS 650.93]KIX08052.1 hypothetical protein Z518_02707 [Rhinocladiella mackenziei CBS 650.93]